MKAKIAENGVVVEFETEAEVMAFDNLIQKNASTTFPVYPVKREYGGTLAIRNIPIIFTRPDKQRDEDLLPGLQKEAIRRMERIRLWGLLQDVIKNHPPGRNGFDNSAQINGLSIASNIIFNEGL